MEKCGLKNKSNRCCYQCFLWYSFCELLRWEFSPLNYIYGKSLICNWSLNSHWKLQRAQNGCLMAHKAFLTIMKYLTSVPVVMWQHFRCLATDSPIWLVVEFCGHMTAICNVCCQFPAKKMPIWKNGFAFTSVNLLNKCGWFTENPLQKML